jgi:hypothetical protein
MHVTFCVQKHKTYKARVSRDCEQISLLGLYALYNESQLYAYGFHYRCSSLDTVPLTSRYCFKVLTNEKSGGLTMIPIESIGLALSIHAERFIKICSSLIL